MSAVYGQLHLNKVFLEIKKKKNKLPPRFFDWSRMELLFTEMGEIVEGTELKWNQDLDFEHVKSEVPIRLRGKNGGRKAVYES